MQALCFNFAIMSTCHLAGLSTGAGCLEIDSIFFFSKRLTEAQPYKCVSLSNIYSNYFLDGMFKLSVTDINVELSVISMYVCIECVW